MISGAVCHRAPWLVTGVPGEFAPIADGAVVVSDGRIVAVGRFADCRDRAGAVVDHHGFVLVPALVNGHTHLELSALAELGQGATAAGDMPAWIGALLARRAELAAAGFDTGDAARAALAGLLASGCGLVADIGNDPASAALADASAVEVLFFYELLGLTRESEARALALLASLAEATSATPHAPYSVTPRLLLDLKKRCRRLGQPYSIHLAESRDEVALLADGSGGFPDFFRQRGVWDGSFRPPGCSPVAYLERLGVLDGQCLCVHCVQLDDADIDILARTRAKVCLCPGSNSFLGVGRPPTGKLLAAGILPALGTDSLASNPLLSIWREMRLLRAGEPGLDPATVFAMATRGGAEALGRGASHGRLGVGRSARLLAVACDAATKGGDVFDFLTTVGEAVTVQWIG